MDFQNRLVLLASAFLLASPFAAASAGESGFYLGGSVGNTGIEAEIDDGINLPETFDEDDFSWKLFGGYNFALGDVVTLGIEGAYVDLGGPSTEILDIPVGLEASSFNVLGTLGFDIGPVGIFGKAGYASWDVEAFLDDIRIDDDGSDPVYGAGLRLMLGTVELRAEYELYDISDVEDLSMASVGIAFRF
jgi:opacity protein-like surface antigen